MPLTFSQSVSLWGIRLAMLVLVSVLVWQLRGRPKTDRILATFWFAGASFALLHSIGSLIFFHGGSQAEALESTARQTQELLGFRFGAGLFVNYLFCAVWLFDATFRLVNPKVYDRLPRWYGYLVDGFLIFIAINGAIVFKSGLMRYLGLACLFLLAWLWLISNRAVTR